MYILNNNNNNKKWNKSWKMRISSDSMIISIRSSSIHISLNNGIFIIVVIASTRYLIR